jgi:hypothetical protein
MPDLSQDNFQSFFSLGRTEQWVFNLIPIDIEEVISDQIAGNDANKLPTPTFTQNPNNPMIMATRSGQTAKLRVKGGDWIAARKVGANTLLGATRSDSIEFSSGSNVEETYEVVSGYDKNQNSAFDEDEVVQVFKKTPGTSSLVDKIRIVDHQEFDDSIGTLGNFWNYPGYAGDLLQFFGTGERTGVLSEGGDDGVTIVEGITINSQNAGISHPQGLTHPVGAIWDNNNQATTHRFVFPPNSSAAREVLASTAMQMAVTEFINRNKNDLIQGVQAGELRTTSPIGMGTREINFRDTDQLSRPSLAFAFGKITLTLGNFQVRYSVKNSGQLILYGIQITGASFDDLYDFSYYGGEPARSASLVQVGHASLRNDPVNLPNQGKVFFNRVEIATDGFDERWNRTY